MSNEQIQGDRISLPAGVREVLDAIFMAAGGDYHWIDSTQVLGRVCLRIDGLQAELAALRTRLAEVAGPGGPGGTGTVEQPPAVAERDDDAADDSGVILW